jgi:hypothetical protein
MAYRFLGKWDRSPDGESPSAWVDEDTGDLILQGWTIDDEAVRAELEQLRAELEQLRQFVVAPVQIGQPVKHGGHSEFSSGA